MTDIISVFDFTYSKILQEATELNVKIFCRLFDFPHKVRKQTTLNVLTTKNKLL